MIADGPGARARYFLCDDWDRSNGHLAKLADCSPTTIFRVRRELEHWGVIPHREPDLSEDAWRPGPTYHARGPDGLTPRQRARIEVQASPQASNQRLAERARCGRTTIREARRELEWAGQIEVIPPSERERRDRLEDVPQEWWNQLPPQPASMARGLCTTGEHDPDLWSSTNLLPARRAEAISICRRCSALADCAEWSLSLPATEKYAIYGGMSAIERARKRRERKHGAQAAAQAS